jgi:nucleoid DNA-binding protein
MRLKEISEGVAKTCDMPVRSVLKAQMETFRQLRVAIESGERVAIPGFGIFFLKEIAEKDGKPAEKMVRLRMTDAVADESDAGKDKRAERAEKRAARRQNPESAPEAAK